MPKVFGSGKFIYIVLIFKEPYNLKHYFSKLSDGRFILFQLFYSKTIVKKNYHSL